MLRSLALASLLALVSVLALGACSDDETVAPIFSVRDTSSGVDDADDDTAVAADADTEPNTDTLGAQDTGSALDTLAPGDTGSPPVDTVQPTACLSGDRVCATMTSWRECLPDGSDYGAPVECADDEDCREGRCVVHCPNDPKFGSYVGCEFWATDLPNYPDPGLNPTPEDLPWALVVSNPGAFDVRVGFEMPPLFTYVPADDVVPAGGSSVFQLPNINVEGTSLRPKGVHLTATGPVLVHQFNPWDHLFSNDASLLLPDPLLGSEYTILTLQSGASEIEIIPGFTFPNQNGYFTVIAAYDDTEVTFQVTAPVRASGLIPALVEGQIHTVEMNRGDVLSIQSDTETLGGNADLTGSRVTSTKPVAVFGGHEEAVIGDQVPNGEGGMTSPCCADHLEDQMLPKALLGTHYYAVKSPPRGTTVIEPDFWRIQALEPNTTVTTTPAQPGAASVTLAQVGDFVEIKTNQTFEINATAPVQVGQYLVCRDNTEAFTGDPSLVLLVPADRFRKDYLISLPDGYSLRLAMVRPTGTVLTIDGAPITETFTPLGATGWEYGYLTVDPGVRVVSGDQRFGLTVFGYNNAVSFGVIGGLAGPGE